MGWLVATALLPIVFVLVAVHTVPKLTLLMLRIVFLPMMLLTRQ